MDTGRSVFWDDLASDLQDPQFLREYVAESIRIATIDRIVNELDAALDGRPGRRGGPGAGDQLRAGDRTAASSIQPTSTRRSARSPRSRQLSGMRVVLEPLGASDPRADHPYAA